MLVLRGVVRMQGQQFKLCLVCQSIPLGHPAADRARRQKTLHLSGSDGGRAGRIAIES